MSIQFILCHNVAANVQVLCISCCINVPSTLLPVNCVTFTVSQLQIQHKIFLRHLLKATLFFSFFCKKEKNRKKICCAVLSMTASMLLKVIDTLIFASWWRWWWKLFTKKNKTTATTKILKKEQYRLQTLWATTI